MRRRLLIAMIVAVGAVSIWLVAHEHLSLDRLASHEYELREVIRARPFVAYAVGFAIYTLVSLFPGTSGKSIVCGWLYGFWQALSMVTLALTLAALGGFTISRYLLGDWVQKRFRKIVDRSSRRLDRDGVFYLLTVRMLHVPFTLVNYVSGVSQVRMSVFGWTTLVGLIPSTAIFVGLGASLPTLQELQRDGVTKLLAPELLVALALMGGLPWMARWVVRKLPSRTDTSRAGSDATRSDVTGFEGY